MSEIAGYVTIEEAAEIIGVSRAQVQRYCVDGRLEAFRAGRRSWLIPEKAAKNFERPPMGNPLFLTDKNPRKNLRKRRT